MSLAGAAHPSSSASRATGSSTWGTSSRPVCSAASTAMAWSRSTRVWAALVRRVVSSRTRRTPSSAAFSTMVSSRVRFTRATASSSSGGRRRGRVRGAHGQTNLALGGLGQHRAPFAVAAIEQVHLRARCEPHDVQQVVRLLRRQGQVGLSMQGDGNEQADHAIRRGTRAPRPQACGRIDTDERPLDTLRDRPSPRAGPTGRDPVLGPAERQPSGGATSSGGR